jgi:hypothetical protein
MRDTNSIVTGLQMPREFVSETVDDDHLFDLGKSQTCAYKPRSLDPHVLELCSWMSQKANGRPLQAETPAHQWPS